jgi:RNA-directed DNA polymerase
LSRFKDLKRAKSLNDLAFLLGYQPKSLAFILYKIPDESKYSEFTIPKKSGGVRNIRAPTIRLKKLQRRLADLLYECADEIKPELEKAKYSKGKDLKRKRGEKSISHGFQKGLSITSNAERHISKKYVFNIDIANFFPSFNFGRVRGYFIKNDKFKLQPKVATIIAQIACHNNELPQGSPCSPIISNFIAEILDVHLVRLAKRYGCTYTRYADDLTFSTSLKGFPKQIAYMKFWSKNKWITSKQLEKCIQSSGYEINSRKTHMQYSDTRQIVTGLVVNKVVNTKNEYYRYARSMCHSLFHKGYFTLPKVMSNGKKTKASIWGVLNSIFTKFSWKSSKHLKISESQNTEGVVETKGSIQQLEGILSYIYHIKSYRNKFADTGYRHSRHDGYRQPKRDNENPKYPPLNRTNEYKHESHKVAIDGIKNLYSKFLFFKHFYYLEAPLIFCEGKTDNVYLRCALNRLSPAYPELAEEVDKKLKFKIKFFNRTETASEMLKLAEGASGMKFVLLEYQRLISKFTCEGKRHPVIMIVDDDKAGRDVISASSCYSSVKSGRPHHLVENLYLITLPNTVRIKNTEMEDYFDSAVLNEKLGVKSFQRKNVKLDLKNEYGKDHFARYVVKAKQDTINFDAFKPLLNKITDIVKTHV